jgi:cytochrome c-type biogenesis protein CcmH/NrfG
MEETVRQYIAELATLDDCYFGKDREKQIRAKIEQSLALLDQKPIDLVQNKKEKADLHYLRGKTLEYDPEFSKAAEENLSKAIKLMPSKHEAWDALGHVYWKKGDLANSKKSFETSLELDDKNKGTLCQLSMVVRQAREENLEKRRENFAQSIAYAKQAVNLDLADSNSWYVLGNAHLTNFFANHLGTDQLEQALAAYKQTEKALKLPNPDLYFNRATILEYLERY